MVIFRVVLACQVRHSGDLCAKSLMPVSLMRKEWTRAKYKKIILVDAGLAKHRQPNFDFTFIPILSSTFDIYYFDLTNLILYLIFLI